MHVFEPYDATFRLRDDLLGQHDDVARLELDRARDKPRQVVAFPDFRKTFDRDDANLSAQGIPVRRIPACAL